MCAPVMPTAFWARCRSATRLASSSSSSDGIAALPSITADVSCSSPVGVPSASTGDRRAVGGLHRTSDPGPLELTCVHQRGLRVDHQEVRRVVTDRFVDVLAVQPIRDERVVLRAALNQAFAAPQPGALPAQFRLPLRHWSTSACETSMPSRTRSASGPKTLRGRVNRTARPRRKPAVEARPRNERCPDPGQQEGRHPRAPASCQIGLLDQWNESPQAHDPPAFGLSMVKPCFSMESTKSITAPCR